jgi:hypothetical protein
VRNSSGIKIFVKTTIFPSPIGLDPLNFMIKKEFNMFLKFEKSILNFRFGMEEIDPREFAKIVNKTHIIFKPSNRSNCRTPNIGINKFKWRSGHMSRNRIRDLMALSKLTRIANICMLIITKR